MSDSFDHVAFLSRSETRFRLLAHLAARGPATRRELREELETSQSTVVRSVQALARRGWVEDGGGEVRATGTGALVADAYGELLDAVDETTDLAPFLRWFPHDEFGPSLSELHGAAVTTSSQGDPYAPARKQTELVRTADHVRTALPSIDLAGSRVVHERVVAGDLGGEVVVGPDLGETIRQGEFARLFRENIRTDRLFVTVSDVELPFYLGLDGGETVQLGVEDDDGIPQALLETDGDPVRAWAEETFREYRDRGTELTAADL